MNEEEFRETAWELLDECIMKNEFKDEPSRFIKWFHDNDPYIKKIKDQTYCTMCGNILDGYAKECEVKPVD